MKVWTIGHSTQSASAFTQLLLDAHIQMLLDIRRFPMSRRNPQFNRDELAAALQEQSIDYRHEPGLGGRRQPVADSPNLGLRDRGFRGFADYMQTQEFEDEVFRSLELSNNHRVAFMCAEAVPWRCHRSLIADALTARGIEVCHILGDKQRKHSLSGLARVDGSRVHYPALL